MANRIKKISISDIRLDSAAAEIWISVYPVHLTSTTQVLGRLMGPRCPYTTTVEVAYSIREHARKYGKIILRVIIPEPSFWDPVSPFLYQGPVELWQDGQCCDQVQVRHGLRILSLGSRGLRWNGQPLTIFGTAYSDCSEQDARRLHQSGYNLLLVPLTPDTTDLWDFADQLGFLVIGQINTGDELQRAYDLSEHTCCFGWLLNTEMMQDPWAIAMFSLPTSTLQNIEKAQLVGVELSQAPTEPLPKAISFVACKEEVLPALAGIQLPKLVLGNRLAREEDVVKEPVPDLLGWIDANL